MCEFFVFLVNEVDVNSKTPLFCVEEAFFVFYYLFRLLFNAHYLKTEKIVLYIKRSFFDWRKLFLMSPFMRLFCCWFSFFLARGCFSSCGREGCAMSYLIWGCFLIHLIFFFNDLMKYNHGFFFPVVFFVRFSLRGRFFFLLICKKKKIFVEWIGLFVEWVVGEFVFFWFQFFFEWD